MQAFLVSGKGFHLHNFIYQAIANNDIHIYYLALAGETRAELLSQVRRSQAVESKSSQKHNELDESLLTVITAATGSVHLGFEPAQLKDKQIAQVWHFMPICDFSEHSTDLDVLNRHQLIAHLIGISSAIDAVFNFVNSDAVVGNQSNLQEEELANLHRLSDHDTDRPWTSVEDIVSASCQKASVPCRIFRTSILLAESSDAAQESFLSGFLLAILSLRQKVNRKVPTYFDRYPVKLLAPTATQLNFIPVAKASQLMLATAIKKNTCQRYTVTAQENTPLVDFAVSIANATGLKIEVTADRDNLMPPDLLLARSIADSQSHFVGSQSHTVSSEKTTALTVCGDFSLENELARCVDSVQTKLATVEEKQLKDDDKTDLSLQQKQLETTDGTLNYLVGGSGEQSIFIINAFGLNLDFWRPLLSLLGQRYKLIFWQHRNQQHSDDPNNVYYDDTNDVQRYIEDTSLLLGHENLSACHLLAWCSGPKLALALAHERPELILSITLLTPSFPGVAGFENQDSAFEKSLLTMCSLVNKMPKSVSTMIISMQKIREDEKGDLDRFDQAINKEKTVSVLSVADQNHADLLYEPFTEATKMVDYSRQLVNFRQHDISPLIQSIKQPALLITSSDDNTTSSPRAISLCQALPNAVGYNVIGGNHYLQTEQPRLITQLIDNFINAGVNMNIEHKFLARTL